MVEGRSGLREKRSWVVDSACFASELGIAFPGEIHKYLPFLYLIPSLPAPDLKQTAIKRSDGRFPINSP